MLGYLLPQVMKSQSGLSGCSCRKEVHSLLLLLLYPNPAATCHTSLGSVNVVHPHAAAAVM
jgi:hypothetical protein